VDIIYIGGSGRSGSTLLDRVLGQVPGIASGGEVLDVWRAGVGENRLCGCGAAFDRCPFWRQVGDEAFGGWQMVDAAAADRLVKSYGYRELLSSRGRGADDDARRELLRNLYRGIARASGARILVDSSKAPAYGFLLAASLQERVAAIQLVRDSRGVAYSWSKVVKRPDTPGRDVEMLRMSAASVSARWILHNGLMERLARRIPATRTRYETFLANPRAELERMLAAVGVPVDDASLDFVADDRVTLKPNHTVMGNPMRLEVGEVKLRLDDAWKAQMPALDRLIVTAATWPWLLRYGYPIR
jgi:hypothetical protein